MRRISAAATLSARDLAAAAFRSHRVCRRAGVDANARFGQDAYCGRSGGAWPKCVAYAGSMIVVAPSVGSTNVSVRQRRPKYARARNLAMLVGVIDFGRAKLVCRRAASMCRETRNCLVGTSVAMLGLVASWPCGRIEFRHRGGFTGWLRPLTVGLRRRCVSSCAGACRCWVCG